MMHKKTEFNIFGGRFGYESVKHENKLWSIFLKKI